MSLQITQPPTAILDYIESHDPDGLRLFYPRIYSNIGPWHSPKLLAKYLYASVLESKAMKEEVGTSIRLMMPALMLIVERKMPLHFLDPKFLNAIKRTDFKEEIHWMDMKLPFEEGILVLPKGGLVHPTDGECGFLFWSRLRPGLHSPGLGVKPIEVCRHSLAVVGLCPDSGVYYDFCVTDEKRPVVRINSLFYDGAQSEAGVPEIEWQEPTAKLMGGIALGSGKSKTTLTTPPMPTHTNMSLMDSPLDMSDAPFVEQMGLVFFGVMLALNARPNLFHQGQREKIVKPSVPSQPPKEFWSPNVIGFNYRPPSQDLGGSHASPRLHWRRGHFRSQPIGVGRKERKTIWIEPMLIGAES